MRVSTRWDEPLNEHHSLEILKTMALDHARAGGRVGEEIAALIEANDFLSICRFELDYKTISVPDAIECRQALAFFQKAEFLSLGIDREVVAYEKFKQSELLCRKTNEIFRFVNRGSERFALRPGDVLVLHKARRKIAQILGPVPRLEALRPRFGPGSTNSVRKAQACPMNKMASGLTCSFNLLVAPELQKLLNDIPHWTAAFSSFSIDEDGWLVEKVPLTVMPGVLEFVPKNALTHRAIVKPATVNGYFQMAYGDYMTQRLKTFGIDISDQTLNQRLAREGSLTGELATLDLSSASDTVATELVRFLLPESWFRILSVLREDSLIYRGEEIILEKFSSMGNGFTFPLETLIFWALTWATCEGGTVSAYGDDIICPSAKAEAVMWTLSLCGFVINSAKSFWDGPFRESCGCDYLYGIDVRPCYTKEPCSGESLFVLHNFYVRNFDVDRAALVRRFIPGSLKIFGPDGFGDGHLLGEWTARYKYRVLNKGYSGTFFDTFSKTPLTHVSIYPGDWISPLYHIYVSGSSACPIQRQAGNREPNLEFDRSGRPLWGLPGVGGYRRTSIYTLSR